MSTSQEIRDAQVAKRILSDRSVVFDVIYVDPDTAATLTFPCVSLGQAVRLKEIIDAIGVTVDAP